FQVNAIRGRGTSLGIDVRVDFRCVQIIDIGRGDVWSVHDVISWVLVGPRSLPAGSVGNAEDRVDLEKIMRPDLCAAAVGVELLRQKGHVSAATEELSCDEVDRLVVYDFGSRAVRGGLATGRAGRVEGPVVAIVIVNAGCFRRSPRQLR